MTGVCYVGFSRKYLETVAVSVFTLRKWFDGPVTVFTDVPDYLPELSKDGRVNLELAPTPHERAKAAPAFYVKSCIPDVSPYDSTLLLDADTLVDGDLGPLLQSPKADTVVLAKHPSGRVGSGPSQAKVQTAVERGLVHPAQLQRLMKTNPWGINSGVVSFTKRVTLAKRWQQLTLVFDRHFIHDELALQLIYPYHPHVLVGAEYNRLVICEPTAAKSVIWHYASGYLGLGRAAELWCNSVTEMYDRDWGGTRSWFDGDIELLREAPRADLELPRE